MASRMASPAMDPALSANSGGPPEYRRHHSDAREPDGGRESTLGSASDPWRVGQSGRQSIGANHLAVVAAGTSPAVTDVAYLSAESRRHAGLDRFLYRTDPHGPNPVRLRRADASAPADRSRQCHRASDSGLDGTAAD